MIVKHGGCSSPMSAHGMTYMRKQGFQSTVYGFYHAHKRTLPWRETTDPYKILISEFMLQQTQVSRVVEKYVSFIERFPAIEDVANASLQVILNAWSGLGYNRRALALKKLADIVTGTFNGEVPDTVDELKKLPGVGDATARAICAFAFDQPVVFLETNIRAVFIHHFFSDREQVEDREILPLVEKTLDTRHPREWYYALMDYGVVLKKLHGNPSRRSAHYKKQSTFAGSDRQIRGAIIKLLVNGSGMKTATLFARLPFAKSRVKRIIDRLAHEGFIELRGSRISIAKHT